MQSKQDGTEKELRK